MQIVLYSDDINLLDYWQESINRECHIVYDLEDLYRTNSSLIVINHSACKPTCKEVLQKLIANMADQAKQQQQGAAQSGQPQPSTTAAPVNFPQQQGVTI